MIFNLGRLNLNLVGRSLFSLVWLGRLLFKFDLKLLIYVFGKFWISKMVHRKTLIDIA